MNIHVLQVLPMNTGVEGGETAIKLARRWGYDVKVRTQACSQGAGSSAGARRLQPHCLVRISCVIQLPFRCCPLQGVAK